MEQDLKIPGVYPRLNVPGYLYHIVEEYDFHSDHNSFTYRCRLCGAGCISRYEIARHLWRCVYEWYLSTACVAVNPDTFDWLNRDHYECVCGYECGWIGRLRRHLVGCSYLPATIVAKELALVGSQEPEDDDLPF